MVTIPTEKIVREACKKFDRENSVIEQAVAELFHRYPKNDQLDHVLLKVVTLNCLYSTQIPTHSQIVPNLVDMAQHIHRNGRLIDAGLATTTPIIVDTIANPDVPNKQTRCYFSFATKYCSCHQPESYPLWDSNVRGYLESLQKQTGFPNNFEVNGYWEYPQFYRVMSKLRERYGLSSLSFKDIDKFLWLHGKQ